MSTHANYISSSRAGVQALFLLLMALSRLISCHFTKAIIVFIILESSLFQFAFAQNVQEGRDFKKYEIDDGANKGKALIYCANESGLSNRVHTHPITG